LPDIADCFDETCDDYSMSEGFDGRSGVEQSLNDAEVGSVVVDVRFHAFILFEGAARLKLPVVLRSPQCGLKSTPSVSGRILAIP